MGGGGRDSRKGRGLRVALATGSYNHIADGVALTLNRLVARLLGAGGEVLVAAPGGRAQAFEARGEVVRAPSAPIPFRPEYRLTLGMSGSLRRRLEAFEPDIVHLATPDPLGRQMQTFAKVHGLPIVASYHTRYETYLKDYGLAFLQRPVASWMKRFYGACAEVYVPSASMADQLKAEGFADNLHLWPRGVDTARFDPARRSSAFRREIGADNNSPVIAFVGRLVREKRLDTLIEALAGLDRLGAPHRVLIVGDGPDRAKLRRALPRAEFTGFLEGAALAQAYASADVFLFPSDTESFGNVTLEAMASGLPAVVADATGSRCLVVDGETGFLAPAGDAGAFATCLERLIEAPDLRRSMGLAARVRSLAFSWDAAMDGLIGRYEALARSPRLAVA